MENISYYEEYSSSIMFEKTVTTICMWLMYTAICQSLNFFGIVTNIINISCFVKQGFQDAITISLFGLSISDLCSLITMAWMCVAFTPAVLAADLPLNIIDVSYLVSGTPHYAFVRVSSCITAMITIERCLSVTVPLKVKHIFTPTRTAAIVVFIFLVFSASIAPVYVVNRLESRFCPLKNRSVIVGVSTQDRMHVERIAFSINNLIIPVSSFLVIAISTVVLALQLSKESTWIKAIINDTQAGRISSRNTKVARMVIIMSTLFIFCYAPLIIITITAVFIPDLYFQGNKFHISLAIGGFTYTLESLNLSMNMFIYLNMSTKYKNAFRKLFAMI